MIRDSKVSRRNSGKNLNFEETENIPLNVNLHELLVDRMSIDPCSRPPLNRIQEPSQNPSKPDQELGFKSSKVQRTPTKSKIRNTESGVSMRTPEKPKNRFGWGQDSRDEGRIGNVNTPRSCKTPGRPSLGFSEANSTLSTPTKSVSRPPNPSFRPPVSGGARTSSFTALSKGIPVICNTYTTVNTIEVPHFDLREDPSFWMDHNVQVLIRVRPLNGMEISSQGYSRCLKQESAQCLTWVGHPETRFTFDHVACETIDQETLFKMVGLPMVENCLSGYNSCMFAYGQTGSGKTHTMLGEINDLEVKPSPYRGMTPRIFEFLFARIIAEEESRKDERLKYNCKCSFLEIYNEQITDLLDPSSTNLQLREDVKKGVYVENLTEFEVHSVNDILKLLTQGSANRRVAATNMNRESSRSHSVFTCVIESTWEKDSTSNLRFARLNLVDLAGSERQKTSGAEGERLKEAANINKSLSTLGHVIMVLVDAVNARTRHVPYRDSKLTFLLQDSLGGNSKTMIIANVSPSLSSATETLNTLKFAQRAKLIQNNAVINEDASGDVAALQHQIRLLKEELAILKRHNISRSLSCSSKDENYSIASSLEMNRLKVDNVLGEDMILRVSCKQLKSLESSLNGALRREKSTESCIKQLEAQIEQLNCLVHQREEENRCTKMMLKFREDKIQRMEAVLAGSIAADSYLLEENNKLHEEIQMLSAKVDRNPEVTRFAVENIRLLEQLKRFQDFYEEGERETLMTEVSELRDQLVLFLDENNHMNPSKEAAEETKETNSLESELKTRDEELEKCRDNLNSCLERNAKLCREITDLKAILETQKAAMNDQDSGVEVIKESTLELPSIGEQNDDNLEKDTEEVVNLQLEIEILKIILKEERSIRGETEDKFSFITKQYENLREKLLEDLRNTNKQEYDEILHEKELEIGSLQMQMHESILKEKENQQELILLREKCEEKDKKFIILSQEFDLLTNKIEEVLTVGYNALDDALDMIGDTKRTQVSEQLQIIARRISEKELRIEELNLCLEDAKNRGNEMDSMLRSLRGATLVMSEAHQQDFIKKDEEIHRLLSDLKEKDFIITQLEEQKKLYELELMDAKINAAQQAVESCCYLDKFVETQAKIKEADLMIENLVSENEAMKMEISHQDQLLNAKEIELFIMLSKLEQLASEINDLEKEKISVYTVLEKFKEEIIIFHVDMELKDLMSMERKNVEVSLLQKQVHVQEEALKTTHARANENEANTVKEKTIYELEFMDAKLNAAQQAVESCIYLDKFVETQHNIEEAESMINKLVTENKAIKMDISHQNQVINDKDEELRFLEEKLVTAKEIELLIMLSKLQQMASENNDLEKEKLSVYAVLEKFKEEVIILHVDMKLKDLILMEEDAEVRLLQKQVNVQEEALKMAQARAEENEAIATEEKRLYELELTNAWLSAAQHSVESCCYLDKFVGTQHVIKEADFVVNKIVNENKAMKIEIADFIDEKDMLEKRLKTETMEMKSEIEELEHMILQIHDKLEQVTSEHNDLEKENANLSTVLEMAQARAEENEAIATEEKRLYEHELTNAWLSAAQQSVESCCYLDKFVGTQHNIKEADFAVNKLVNESKAMKIEIAAFLNEKDILEKRLKTETLEMKSEIEELEHMILQIRGKLEQVTSEYNDLEEENANLSTVLEKFKEKIIIFYVDLHLKDSVFLEKDAEVGVLQKQVEIHKDENETLLVIINDLKDDIKEFEVSYEALECEFYENVIKSLVLEARLSEIVQDALKAKETTEEQLKKHKEENETLVVIINDLKDDIKEFEDSYEALECQLYENIVKSLVLEAQLTENVQDALEAKESTEGRLGKASLEFTTVLGEKINLIESLKGDMEIVMSERYDLHVELLRAKEELKLAQATAKENEAIAVNTKQVCETSKLYAKEKEEELKLYEKTVEELEFTVDVLRNQVDLVKGDSESQRLKREELQLELQKMYHQEHLLTAKNENFKEENNMLKAQNGEMGHNLRREEAKVRRVKEELASLRAAIGKNFS